MTSVASLEQLLDTVNALPTKAGRSYFSYLAPLSNNPRRLPNSSPQDSFFTFVDTQGKPARMHTFMKANTRPSMIKDNKAHTQLTEYFNLYTDEDQPYFFEDKLKMCRALLCVESIEKDSPGIPLGVVNMSQDTIKCCLKIQSETEKRFNRYNAVFELQSPLTHKLINLRAARGSVESCLSIDPFEQDEISPSVLKQNRINELLANGAIDDPLFLDDLSDPRGLWENTIRGMNARRSILVEKPKIYNTAGELIHPSTYAEEIQDDQLLFAEISLSMWNFTGSKARPKKTSNYPSKEASSRRVYHITIEEMHLLDPEPDEHKAWLIQHLKGEVDTSLDEVGGGRGSTAPSESGSLTSTDKTIDDDAHMEVEEGQVVDGQPNGDGSNLGIGGSMHAPRTAVATGSKRAYVGDDDMPNKRKHTTTTSKKEGAPAVRGARNGRKSG
ncbi:hypothetical protein V5O48_009140 [Marasmius crinis-equi]|uniref:Uncharacterized protein n=1 Tax=Marasmius crinis-equi TaxID=585013 RepID=A0ABR3FBY4_9AGAR